VGRGPGRWTARPGSDRGLMAQLNAAPKPAVPSVSVFWCSMASEGDLAPFLSKPLKKCSAKRKARSAPPNMYPNWQKFSPCIVSDSSFLVLFFFFSPSKYSIQTEGIMQIYFCLSNISVIRG